MPHTLQLVLLLLAAAVIAVVACRLVRLPPIVGYLVVGIVVGPHALALVPDNAAVRELAEFGIVFLMFSVGLEFSLPQLTAMRRAVFGLGSSQVLLTLVVAMLAIRALGVEWLGAFALSGAIAMSSTAIVSKMLAERAELNTAHGRDVVGILLFQDLAVIALLVAIPTLARGEENLAIALVLAAGKAALALGVILVAGQRPMRMWFRVVSRARSDELFMLNLLLVTLGLAAVTWLAGLSFALGAFLAGMLIAETEYRYQVEEDVKPFRDVLLGLFFVSVGMYLDLSMVLSRFVAIALLLVGFIAAKIVIVAALARMFRAPLGAALRIGFYLGHAGEFAIVLVALASELAIVDATTMQMFLAAMVLSMIAAPFLIQFADPIVRRLTANDWLARAAQITSVAARTLARQDHVVICGFGRTGQNLARFLEQEDIAFIALDGDVDRVSEASAAGSNIAYGDATRREVLIAAGLAKARALAVTFADTHAALKILQHCHEINPGLPVIVRTLDDSELDPLLRAGATEVVPEVLEGSLMLASQTLLVMGVPLTRVLAGIRDVREERYSLFRGFYHGATDAADAADNLQPRLHTVVLSEQSAAVGRSRAELDLEGAVEVTGVRRRGSRSLVPQSDFTFDAGDVVVLLGTPDQLARAEARLQQG